MPSIFHEPTLELAVELQRRSKAKYDNSPDDLVRAALFILSHDALGVHRAIGVLVDSGWPGPASGLLRTLFDINISVLVIVNSSSPEMAGFRYFYSGLRRHSRDQAFPTTVRRRMFAQIRARIRLLPKPLRPQAVAVIKEKDRPYWYGQEFATPSAVLGKFGAPGLTWDYSQLSGAAHGSFMGLRLFRENPDEISIEPEPSGPKALSVDFTSCRLVLEVLRFRDLREDLAMASDIAALVGKITAAVASHPAAT